MYKTLSEYTTNMYPSHPHGRTLLFARSFRTVTAQATSVTSHTDKFKVIIVTESGIVKFPRLLKKQYIRDIFADFADMKVITGQSPAKSYLLQIRKNFIRL